jgi:ABC-type Fe3+ transport system permease subunit
VVFGVSVVVIVFCFTKVSRIAYRQMKAISVQQAAVQGPNQNKIKEYKRTFALGVVLLASVLLYCPLLIVKIIALTKGKEWNADFKYTAQSYVVAFTHLQSLVNPLILSLRLSYIRACVIKKLCWR